MRLAALATLLRRDLSRARGALVTSGFGIAAGTAALVYFLALGLGVRAVLLGEVFPVDQIELEPPKAADPGLLALLTGGTDAPGITAEQVTAVRASPDALAVFPKLRFAFPASARGGKELFGYEVGTSEMLGDGIEPDLARSDLAGDAASFDDPMLRAGPPCTDDAGCPAAQYCERPSGAATGSCSDPVPAVVSRFAIELFDKTIAPAHRLPPIGQTLVQRAQGVTFTMRLGESLLGRARLGTPRAVRVRLVGISRRAIDLGATFPLSVVRRWNDEFAGAQAASRFSSIVVTARTADGTAALLSLAAAMRLEPRDTRARDVSVLINGVTSLLVLVAGVILMVSASNIAYTFRVLVVERGGEIALCRALGATARDMRTWTMALAAVVGLLGGGVGLVVARIAALLTDIVAARRIPDFPFKPTTFFAFPVWLWAAGLAFAAFFALLGAWGPARRAAKVDPARALSSSG